MKIDNSLFEENTSGEFGGAIYSSNLTEIRNSQFNNNSGVRGAAIITTTDEGSNLIISDTSFTGNTAEKMGAVGIFKDATLTNVTFENNQSTDEETTEGAGGLFLGSEANVGITNNTFKNNLSATDGGAIGTRGATANNSGAKLDITGSTFTGNQAAGNGGAINNYLYNSTKGEYVYIKDTNFENNKAANGGAIYNHGERDNNGTGKSAAMWIEDSTFTGNIATTGKGGAIYNASTMTINNSQFSGNKANGADNDIYNEGSLTFGSGTTTLAGGIDGTGTTTIETGATLENGSESTISQTEVTNSGTIENAGTVNATTLTNNASSTITNSGTITGTNNTIDNSGTITNSGEISAQTLTNNANATITNNEGKTITATTITNSGEIANSGTVSATALTNNAGATVTNNANATITATTVTNAGTVENAGQVTATDLTNSGTIENEGTISSVNAIANSGTLTSNAGNITISGETKEINNNGTFNIKGGELSGYDVVGTSVDSSKVNIIGEVEIASDKKISKNTVSIGDGTTTGTGSLKLGSDSNLANSTLVIKDGAILITDNGSASSIAGTVEIDAGATWNYQLDVDLADISVEAGTDIGKADNLNVKEDVTSGAAIVSSLHLNKDKTTKTTVQIANKDINATISDSLNRTPDNA